MKKRKKKRKTKLSIFSVANSFDLHIKEPAYACHVDKMHDHVKARKFAAAVRQLLKAQNNGFSHYKYTMVQNEGLCDAMGKRLQRSHSVWTVRS